MPLNACPNLGCSVARRRNVPRVHHAEGYIERPACQLKGLRPMREERAVTGKQRACVLKAITRDFAQRVTLWRHWPDKASISACNVQMEGKGPEHNAGLVLEGIVRRISNAR